MSQLDTDKQEADREAQRELDLENQQAVERDMEMREEVEDYE